MVRCFSGVGEQSDGRWMFQRKLSPSSSWWFPLQGLWEWECFQDKGSLRLPKRIFFLEKFQTAFDPPALIFGKLYCKFLSETHDRSIVYNDKNLQYKFLDWKRPPPPLRTFLKIHPFWRCAASLILRAVGPVWGCCVSSKYEIPKKTNFQSQKPKIPKINVHPRRGAELLGQWEDVVGARETRKLSFASSLLRGVTGICYTLIFDFTVNKTITDGGSTAPQNFCYQS